MDLEGQKWVYGQGTFLGRKLIYKGYLSQLTLPKPSWDLDMNLGLANLDLEHFKLDFCVTKKSLRPRHSLGP